jgi:hypothetical protein
MQKPQKWSMLYLPNSTPPFADATAHTHHYKLNDIDKQRLLASIRESPTYTRPQQNNRVHQLLLQPSTDVKQDN